MAKIGKVNFKNTIRNEGIFEADIFVDNMFCGKLKTIIDKNQVCEKLELFIHPVGYQKIVEEGKAFSTMYSNSFPKSQQKEELVVLLLKTLIMLEDLKSDFDEVCSIGKCHAVLLVQYENGMLLLPASDRDVLYAIELLLKHDESVEQTLVLEEELFYLETDHDLKNHTILNFYGLS